VQYVYVIPDALVEVRYGRTAQRAEADAHVRKTARQDCAEGPDWEKQINRYPEK
jgi:hypothetical protein